MPELPYACGLGTGTLLAGDVVSDPLVPVDGMVAVRRPEPDEELLDRYSVEVPK
jgi:O-succinylbenzoate synthase